jgi:hypothetical protein
VLGISEVLPKKLKIKKGCFPLFKFNAIRPLPTKHMSEG